MQRLRLTMALATLLALTPGVMAQTANSSGGAGSATQPSSGGAVNGGTANGENMQTSSGGAGAGQLKIGPPTAVEQQEQQKSDQATEQICKGC